MKNIFWTTTCKRIQVFKKIISEEKLFRSDGAIRHWINQNNVLFVGLARVRRKYVGCVVIIAHKGSNYYNIGVYVDPEFRKKGIGSKLAKLGMNWAKRNEVLLVHNSNNIYLKESVPC